MGLYEQFGGTYSAKYKPLVKYTDWNTYKSTSFKVSSTNLFNDNLAVIGGTINGTNYITKLGNNTYRVFYNNAITYLNQSSILKVGAWYELTCKVHPGAIGYCKIDTINGPVVIQSGKIYFQANETTFKIYRNSTPADVTFTIYSLKECIYYPGFQFINDYSRKPVNDMISYFGKGVSFNGTNQAIRIPSASLPTIDKNSDWSYLITIKNTPNSIRGKIILPHFCNVAIERKANNNLVFVFDDSILGNVEKVIQSDNIYQGTLTCVKQGSNIKLYSNGVLIHTVAINTLLDGVNALCIGGVSDYSQYSLSICKDLYIFNTALSDDNIQRAFTHPNVFYKEANANPNCLVLMPLCENDKFVRNYKTYVEGAELVSDITGDTLVVNNYNATYTKDTTTKRLGVSSNKFVWLTSTTTLYARTSLPTLTVGKTYLIKAWYKTNLATPVALLCSYGTSQQSSGMYLTGAVDSLGFKEFACIKTITEHTQQYMVQVYMVTTDPTAIIWLDGEFSVKEVQGGVYLIDNFADTCRTNANRLTFGLQTYSLKRDILGCVKSPSDFVELDGYGYMESMYSPPVTANQETLEVIIKKPEAVDNVYGKYVSGGGFSGNFTIEILPNYNTSSYIVNIRYRGATYQSILWVNNIMSITIVYTGTLVKIYINGVLKNIGTASTNFIDKVPFRFGCSTTLREQVRLAQVRLFSFYDSAFTAEQVLSNFNKYSAKGLMS